MLLNVNIINPDPVKNDYVVVVFFVSTDSQDKQGQGATHEREDKDCTLNGEKVTQD